MSACGNIINNLVMDACGKAAASGTNVRVYLANFDDVDKSKSVVANGVLTDLQMKASKKLYKLDSKPRSTEGTATYNTGTYGGSFDHSVTLRAFTKDQEVKDFMNTLVAARIIAIVENNEAGKDKTGQLVGGTKYEVYGWDSGLILTEMPWSTTLSDTVTYSATLSSDENSKEGQLPLSVFKTSLEDTETMLNGLVTE